MGDDDKTLSTAEQMVLGQFKARMNGIAADLDEIAAVFNALEPDDIETAFEDETKRELLMSMLPALEAIGGTTNGARLLFTVLRVTIQDDAIVQQFKAHVEEQEGGHHRRADMISQKDADDLRAMLAEPAADEPRRFTVGSDGQAEEDEQASG